jgi:hypothetical protein
MLKGIQSSRLCNLLIIHIMEKPLGFDLVLQ